MIPIVNTSITLSSYMILDSLVSYFPSTLNLLFLEEGVRAVVPKGIIFSNKVPSAEHL